MTKSQNEPKGSSDPAVGGEATNTLGTHWKQANNGSTGTKPQAGRPPNRPPYEQHLRVTKAFQN